MEQNYKREQMAQGLRTRDKIWAVKILEIRENSLVFRRSFRDDKTISIPVSCPQAYKVGQYIDVIVWSTGTSSYGAKLIGTTPDAFIPADGAEIAV